VKQRSAAFRKACRVLDVDPATPLEEVSRRYHALAQDLHPDKRGNDPMAAARMVEVNGAWARIKYEARKRHTRMTLAERAHERPAARCTWPHPVTTQSPAFDGYELRPTERARSYRVMKGGVLWLTLHRHPDDERLLFARNDRGRVVRLTGIGLWSDADGEVRPVG
jgi:DnaJ-domain-containing protein 1